MNHETVLVFTRNGLGHAPEELQQKLSGTFLALLDQSDIPPAKILLYTDGVKLACEGSPVLAQFKALEARGVEIILCKTCLDYFGLAENVAVGIVGGMTDIIEAMRLAGKVISL